MFSLPLPVFFVLLAVNPQSMRQHAAPFPEPHDYGRGSFKQPGPTLLLKKALRSFACVRRRHKTHQSRCR